MFVAAAAEWRDAVDGASVRGRSAEQEAVEHTVVDTVGQVVWRFTRLDKLVRATAAAAAEAEAYTRSLLSSS